MCWGGKGALVQEDLSATLATNQDQVLFCPAFGFKAGQSDGGLGFEEEVSPTIGADMSGTEPTVLCQAIDSHPQDKRVGFSKDGTVQTLPARMGTGGGNVPFILQAIPTSQVRKFCARQNSYFRPGLSSRETSQPGGITQEGGSP